MASIIVLSVFLASFSRLSEPEVVVGIPSTPIVASPAKEISPVIPEILKKISWCESGNRQFNADGSVYHGEINPKDTGKYQINTFWNGEEAKRLGFDLDTLEGNTKMALYMYKYQGTTPWNWSKHCWGDPDRVWTVKNGEYFSKK